MQYRVNYLVLKNSLFKLNWELKCETLAKGKAGQGQDEEENRIFTGSHGKSILVLDSNEDFSYFKKKRLLIACGDSMTIQALGFSKLPL